MNYLEYRKSGPKRRSDSPGVLQVSQIGQCEADCQPYFRSSIPGDSFGNTDMHLLHTNPCVWISFLKEVGLDKACKWASRGNAESGNTQGEAIRGTVISAT